jgi:hypothetical protein
MKEDHMRYDRFFGCLRTVVLSILLSVFLHGCSPGRKTTSNVTLRQRQNMESVSIQVRGPRTRVAIGTLYLGIAPVTASLTKGDHIVLQDDNGFRFHAVYPGGKKIVFQREKGGRWHMLSWGRNQVVAVDGIDIKNPTEMIPKTSGHLWVRVVSPMAVK